MTTDAKYIYVLFSSFPKTKIGSTENIEATKKRLEKEEGCELGMVYLSPLLINYREIEKMCIRNFADSSLGNGWVKKDSCFIVDYLERTIRDCGVLKTPSEQTQIEYGVNPDKCFLIGSTRADLIGMRLIDLYYMCSSERIENINYVLVMALSDGKTVKRFCLDGHKIRPYGEFPVGEYKIKMITPDAKTPKEQFAEYAFHHFVKYDTQPMDCVKQVRGWH